MIRVRRLGRVALAVAIAGGSVLIRPGDLGISPTLDDVPTTAVGADADPGSGTGGTARSGGSRPAGGPIVGLPREGPNSRSTRNLRFAAEPRLLTGYVWPLADGILTLPFGPSPWGSRIVEGELFHDGIDLATVCGDPIVAAHDGIVLAAGRRFDDAMGWIGDLGPYYARLDAEGLWWTLPIAVVIDDGNGYRSIYAHFSSVTVKKGQRVRAGQLIGYEGMSGRASGCHLHYGLFSPAETRTFAIDPRVVKRMLVPPLQIARIDPLLVLPPRVVPKAVVRSDDGSPAAESSASPGPAD